MEIAVRVIAADEHGEDRAVALACACGDLLVVADEAGGSAGGAAAAQAVIEAARYIAAAVPGIDWARWLSDLDTKLQHLGETTAVVALCSNGQVLGASVGDSAAWLVQAASTIDLTAHQRRKPLLGSGRALAVSFGPVPLHGRLLLASDGLFNYVSTTRIQRVLNALPIEAVPAALIDAARLPTGALCDDIAIVIAG